ncbi:MAG: SUMF1/EgtB/PvdO family nonheme iron enzyme [Polyangiaceae bacterium]|nr:SUMF1/EgtB/PvdO family nonheme iron enzyme [Polyangiaceae bacterium]
MTRATAAVTVLGVVALALVTACDALGRLRARPAPDPPQAATEADATAAEADATPSSISDGSDGDDGSDADAAALPSPCPPEMALIGEAVCIDRWEASLVDESGEPHSPYHPVRAKKVRAVSRPDVVPQAHIAAEEAEKACRRADKTLCTTDEWLLGCQGPARPKRVFPYGAKLQKGACNIARREHPMTRLTGGQHRTDAVSLNNPRLNQLSDTVAKTGEFERCATPEGVMDLHGNLLEWTRSTYVRPLAMGGFYLDGATHGAGCSYVTSAHGAQYHDFTTGFRCCKKPDKAALGALSGAPPLPVPRATDDSRDPAGMRSFLDPTGRLPKVSPPAYEPSTAKCPVDMVHVEGLRCSVPVQKCKRWLPRLSAGQKIACAEFEEPTECKSARRKLNYCIDRYEFQPEGYRYPLTHVNWSEAQNLCRGMDKRLCFEDEWEFACEGPDALPYPYGYVRDAKRCNHDFPEEQLVTTPDNFIDRRVARDALPDCKSPFGVFNLVGNVDEWTTRYNQKPPRRSILRGGWWLIGRNRCRAATDRHSELYAGMQTGFRCCRATR